MRQLDLSSLSRLRGAKRKSVQERACRMCATAQPHSQATSESQTQKGAVTGRNNGAPSLSLVIVVDLLFIALSDADDPR